MKGAMMTAASAVQEASAPQASEEACRAVLADGAAVVIYAWKLQGRTVGAMLREAQSAIEELTEKLADAMDTAIGMRAVGGGQQA
jgi:hypothetical protein